MSARLSGLGQTIKKDWKQHWKLYVLLMPCVAYYIIWCYFPMYGIQVAFRQFTPKLGIAGSPWVGLKNFRAFFNGMFAWRVIRNTFLINFMNLVFGFPLPILFAILLNEVRATSFKRVVQTVSYMPYFVSLIVVCGIIVDFTATDGIFGQLARLLGLTPINFLNESKYFRGVYVVSEIWQRLGWDSIIFLAALTAINHELFEAARIDGAGRIKQIIHVTLPGLLPTIAILLVLRIGSMMSLGFEKIILLYNGLTYETADVISSFVYRKGILENDFGYATAVGLFNSVINFVLVVFANKISAVLTETSLW